MSTKVEIEVTVTARTCIELKDGETVVDVTLRDADLYLHGAGPDGAYNKSDIGGESHIEILQVVKHDGHIIPTTNPAPFSLDFSNDIKA